MSTSTVIQPDDPFPADVFPGPVRELIRRAALSMSCDEAFLAVPVLPVLASAIGNTRAVQLKRGWTEPAIVWATLIAESGSMKSPALGTVVKPLREAQLKMFADHADRIDKAGSRSRRAGRRHDVDDQPPRLLGDDVTIPALAPILESNPRGILLFQDELAGWLHGLRRAGEADRARWLTAFNGSALTIDRKTGDRRLIKIPRASVSVCGGIQPEIFSKHITQDSVASGLMARLLVARPPVAIKQWSDIDLPPEVEAAYALVIERLLDLEFGIDYDDQAAPVILRLDPDARTAWVDFYNNHATEQAELPPILAACWQKLEAYAARFALILHCAAWAAESKEGEPQALITTRSVINGIRLAQWFGRQARRIYGGSASTLSVGPACGDTNGDDRLVGIIRSDGGSISTRELMRRSRQYRRSVNDAEQALQGLVDRGLGQWLDVEPGRRGGRPTRRFMLTCGDGDTT